VRNEDQFRYLLLFENMHEQDGSGAMIVSLPGELIWRAEPRKGPGCPVGLFCQGVDQCGQATKGVWGMPRRQEAMKGVEDCEKLGGLVKHELIPRSLN
jgi:hypothetical protein